MRPAPISRNKRSQTYTAVIEGALRLHEFVQTALPDLMRIEQAKAYLVLIRVVINHLQESSIIVSMRTVSIGLTNIPSIVDRRFPGYVRNKLLHHVIRKQMT